VSEKIVLQDEINSRRTSLQEDAKKEENKKGNSK
jgi:hypothetical protein